MINLRSAIPYPSEYVSPFRSSYEHIAKGLFQQMEELVGPWWLHPIHFRRPDIPTVASTARYCIESMKAANYAANGMPVTLGEVLEECKYRHAFLDRPSIKHLNALELCGLVNSAGSGQERRFTPTDALFELDHTTKLYKPSSLKSLAKMVAPAIGGAIAPIVAEGNSNPPIVAGIGVAAAIGARLAVRTDKAISALRYYQDGSV